MHLECDKILNTLRFSNLQWFGQWILWTYMKEMGH